MFNGTCIANMFQSISNKMQRYSLFISVNCSTGFGWIPHPSSGAQNCIYSIWYEVCPENSRIYSVKIFQSYLEASKYSPLLCMHRCQCFFNVLKHSWKDVLGMLRKCASEFSLIASVDSKQRPFSVDLRFGNRNMSAGVRSGEYGGCGRTVVTCLAKRSQTRNDECEGALSCWSIHRFSRHASGLFS